MMGGFGSGRPRTRTCGKVEASRPLDIGKLRRAGVLSEGWSGAWIWTLNGAEVARIGLRMHGGSLRLTYSYRPRGGEWQPIEQTVGIVWRPCRFGGQRPYLRCDGVVNGRHCSRSVTRLFGAGKYFCCRHCYRLSFGSQHEDQWDRALRRANKIRTRLGGEPGTAALFPRKPKHMRDATYERLLDRVIVDEAFAEERLALFAARLMTLDRRVSKGRGRARGSFWS